MVSVHSPLFSCWIGSLTSESTPIIKIATDVFVCFSPLGFGPSGIVCVDRIVVFLDWIITVLICKWFAWYEKNITMFPRYFCVICFFISLNVIGRDGWGKAELSKKNWCHFWLMQFWWTWANPLSVDVFFISCKTVSKQWVSLYSNAGG